MRSTVTVFAGLFLFLGVPVSLYGQGGGSTSTTREWPKEILGRSLKDWIKDLTSPDASIKVKAIQAVPYFGEPAQKEAGPHLIDAITDRDASVRTNALLSISQLGLPADLRAKLVGILRKKMMEDSQGIIRLHCATLLGQMGREAREAIPDLMLALKSGMSFEIRKAAVTALGNVGAGTDKVPTDDRAIRALVEVFYGSPPDSTADVRLEAVMAVALMRPPAQQAECAHIVTALHAVTKGKDKAIEIWGRVGLIAYVHQKAVPTLPTMPNINTEQELKRIANYLNSGENVLVRMHAVRALGTIGANAKSRVDDLITVLSDEKELSLAALAAVALGQMGNAAQKAVPTIEELMKKKDLDDATKDALKEVVARINDKKK
jgi:HEAT repeat protein